ncbi:MAG: amidohydrolase [Salinivirgaceae bacterium]|nr:amidohydrolase [Salinivirgaceae bacterium]
MNDLVNRLIKFRHTLHRFPELSSNEKRTSQIISEFVAQAKPTEIFNNIGGYGVLVIFDSGVPGPVTLFRADMDALPIIERTELPYQSENHGVAHLCGHDGHSTVLAGLAHMISQNRPAKGKVLLLFQPAEETGKGAQQVISDVQFQTINPNSCYAFHNLPGFKKGAIIVKEGSFASASTGMVIDITGKPSHAAHPENGNNPDIAIGELILELNKITENRSDFQDFVLLTIIHVRVGEIAFGTTPGQGVVMLTIRAYLDEDLQKLRSIVQEKTQTIMSKYKLEVAFSFEEPFSATINESRCVDIVRAATKDSNLELIELQEPFRWSEDFGSFSSVAPSVLFGVGSGIDYPQLHNEDYDFPDSIIENALTVFYNIYRNINI